MLASRFGRAAQGMQARLRPPVHTQTASGVRMISGAPLPPPGTVATFSIAPSSMIAASTSVHTSSAESTPETNCIHTATSAPVNATAAGR
ncbi:hypothetical protein [Actinomyces naeslundii]|nr:hypothetical protein [Actinomyces naeslundii]